MLRDHCLLVGGDNQDLYVADSCADARRIDSVFTGIEAQPEPCETSADFGPNRSGVFANTGSEHQAVEPAERARHLSRFERNAVRELLDGIARADLNTAE